MAFRIRRKIMDIENRSLNSVIKVVLADDHAVVRSGTHQFLEQARDIQVIGEASDGEMALTMVERMKPDVAVLDIQMPKMSGIQVSREIQARKLPVGVLILTSYDDAPYISAVMKTGANGYILKTASPEEIINAVRKVYRGKSVLDGMILSQIVANIAETNEPPLYEKLTEREIEILALVAKGLTNRLIGFELEVSDRTVQGHISRIFAKLQVNSRTEAVMRGLSLGWIELPETFNE
ncbi:MAG: DNA-binding response regulator [Anaerolineaceae bacterium]|nr:DNA-binding response regulator [Anaerolineaceae bacterium]